MEYLIFKYIHIVSSTFLFGTGIGSAFYKWRADRTGDVHAMAFTNRNVVLADWLFTTPSIIIQPLSGVALVLLAGFSWTSPWLVASILLYIVAGTCWLPVVKLQLQMRELTDEALASNGELHPDYRAKAKRWFSLGVPAFVAIVTVFYLMTAKPGLFFWG